MDQKNPFLDDIAWAAGKVSEEFVSKRFVFLGPQGRWQENPRSPAQCVSHEILFYAGKLSHTNRAAFFQEVYSCLTKHTSLNNLKKIKAALDKTEVHLIEPLLENKNGKFYPFLVIFRVLTWILVGEAFRINSQLCVPVWNHAARVQCQAYSQQLQALNDLIEKLVLPTKIEKFFEILFKKLAPILPEGLKTIPQLIAEEDRLSSSFNAFLTKAKDPAKREEIYPLIVQRLHPPTGVVTEISPALLRPSLRLLMDDSIDISSGIQYNASVILSVLRDIRSTETLRRAFDRFPVCYTKIRENLSLGLTMKYI